MSRELATTGASSIVACAVGVEHGGILLLLQINKIIKIKVKVKVK